MISDQTRTSRRRMFGGLAAILFVGMAAALQLLVAPLSPDGFLPQATIDGYSEAQLFMLASALGQDAQAAWLYQMLLEYVDPLFVLMFAIWVALSFDKRGLGIFWGVLFALLDLGENGLLLYHLSELGLSDGVFVSMGHSLAQLPEITLFVSMLSGAKLLLATGLVMFILGRDLRNGFQNRNQK